MGNFLRLSNGIPRSFAESSAVTIYDQVYVVPNGGLNSGANISLPNSQTYTGIELEVYRNGQRVRVGDDYTAISTTQIAFVYALLQDEQIRFRIDRVP